MSKPKKTLKKMRRTKINTERALEIVDNIINLIAFTLVVIGTFGLIAIIVQLVFQH